MALEQGSGVLVERFIRGQEHRLLVVGGRVVAAARGDIAYVTGDGNSTVEQLVDSQLNTDPRRGENEDFPLNHLILSREATVLLDLQRQGLSPEAVPAAPGVEVADHHGGAHLGQALRGEHLRCRVGEEGPGEADQLPLPGREGPAPLADHVQVAAGQRRHHLLEPACPLHLGALER